MFDDDDMRWKQIGDIISSGTPGACFGSSTAVSGDGSFFVAGSPAFDTPVAQSNILGETQTDAGQVMTFERQITQGGRKRFRRFSQPTFGNSTFDEYGRKVAMNAAGDRIAIGSSHDAKDVRQNNVYSFSSGRVQAMEFDGVNWKPMGQLLKSEIPNMIDRFGLAVDMNEEGNRIAVGASWAASGNNGRGRVQVYEFDESDDKWVQLGQTIVGFNHSDMFGTTVSLSGNRVAISYLDLFVPSAPAMYVYEYPSNATNTTASNETAWVTVGQRIKGETTSRYNATFDQYNNHLTKNGTILAVGVKQTAEGKENRTYVRVYEHLAADATI